MFPGTSHCFERGRSALRTQEVRYRRSCELLARVSCRQSQGPHPCCKSMVSFSQRIRPSSPISGVSSQVPAYTLPTRRKPKRVASNCFHGHPTPFTSRTRSCSALRDLYRVNKIILPSRRADASITSDALPTSRGSYNIKNTPWVLNSPWSIHFGWSSTGGAYEAAMTCAPSSLRTPPTRNACAAAQAFSER